MDVPTFLKRGAAVALCGALLAQPCLVAVSQAKDSTVLYTVNCGTPDPSVVPSGYSLGACQSRVDQAWGEDGETGYSWGYFSGDPYSVLVGTGSDATDLTKTSWYLSDQGEFVEETAGIEYHFQLPEDCTKVEVTVGVSDGDYIEILSGLEPGEIVVSRTENTTLMEQMMGMMGGGGGS